MKRFFPSLALLSPFMPVIYSRTLRFTSCPLPIPLLPAAYYYTSAQIYRKVERIAQWLPIYPRLKFKNCWHFAIFALSLYACFLFVWFFFFAKMLERKFWKSYFTPKYFSMCLLKINIVDDPCLNQLFRLPSYQFKLEFMPQKAEAWNLVINVSRKMRLNLLPLEAFLFPVTPLT